MTAYLHFDRLDDDLFPESQPGPGRKGLHARVLYPPIDKRIPARPDALVLLAVFRLDEPARVPDPATAPTGWMLTTLQPAADGTSRRRSTVLMPTPKDGNHTMRPESDATVRPLPGAVYRGAWWADLSDWYARRLLRPGMAIDLAYLQQAQVTLVLE